MKNPISLLYVDDERGNLTSFQAFFRKEYEVHTASSAGEAMRILSHVHVDLVLSDQRMPTTTGVEFLEKVATKYPDTTRILITAFSDLKVVIDAVNKGRIARYIQKPWDWPTLSLTVEACAMQHQAAKELAQKNQELEKLNHDLNRFVYSISHDLRSPLMSVLGLIQLHNLNPKDHSAGTVLKMIGDTTHRMDEYIHQMMDYFLNLREETHYETVILPDLLHTLVQDAKAINPEARVDVSISGEMVVTDPFRLRIIVVNLLSNAFRFNKPQVDQHRVSVRARIEPMALVLEVEDNGMGILNEHLNSIFEQFFRTEDGRQRQGSGLGLYIVKEAIDRLGGKVEVSSSSTNGTVFCVSIPNHV
jgi:signal transduction histidine kinase